MRKQPRAERVDSESLFLAKVGVRQGKGQDSRQLSGRNCSFIHHHIIMVFLFLVQTLPRFRTCSAIHSSICNIDLVFITAIFLTTLVNLGAHPYPARHIIEGLLHFNGLVGSLGWKENMGCQFIAQLQ